MSAPIGFPTEVDCSTCGARVELMHAFAHHEDGDRVWTCEDCLERCPDRPGWRRDRNGREWYSARWLSTLAVFAAVTLAAGVAFLAPARASAASSYPPLTRIASAIAGRPVQISCADTTAEWIELVGAARAATDAGDTWFTATTHTPRYAVLSPSACGGLILAALDTTRARGALLRRLNPSVNVSRMEAVGVIALVHESEHLAGIFDESAACAAGKAGLPYAVRELGARPAIEASSRELYTATAIASGWTC